MAVCERQTDTRVVWDVELLHISSLDRARRDAFGEIDLADVNRTEVAPSRCHTHTMLLMVVTASRLSHAQFTSWVFFLLTFSKEHYIT